MDHHAKRRCDTGTSSEHASRPSLLIIGDMTSHCDRREQDSTIRSAQIPCSHIKPGATIQGDSICPLRKGEPIMDQYKRVTSTHN